MSAYVVWTRNFAAVIRISRRAGLAKYRVSPIQNKLTPLSLPSSRGSDIAMQNSALGKDSLSAEILYRLISLEMYEKEGTQI